MQNTSVVVPVCIDAKTFRDFALFDTFVRQRRWRPLALFAAILLASACACFLFIGRAEQATLLGGVLLTVGLGLPAAYLLSFLLSVKQQSKKMRLSATRQAYILTFDPMEGIIAEAGKERASYCWEDIFSVHCMRHAAYLYVTRQKAYLLPDICVNGNSKTLWEIMGRKIPSEKIFGKRPYKQ